MGYKYGYPTYNPTYNYPWTSKWSLGYARVDTLVKASGLAFLLKLSTALEFQTWAPSAQLSQSFSPGIWGLDPEILRNNIRNYLGPKPL